MKAPFHGDDLEPSPLVTVGPRQLDGGFVGLGSAIAEEALPAERPLRERCGKRPCGSMYQVLGT